MRFASAAKHTLAMVGAYRALLAAAPYGGAAVLAYHGLRDDSWPRGTMRFEPLHVTAGMFDAHCNLLRALGCTMLSVADWREIVAGRRPLPPRAVMLTFDDGYRTVLTHALPVLERYRIPATVFICTTPVERRTRFWFDAMAERHDECAVERAKSLPHGEWRELVAAHEVPVAADDPHAPLTIDEVRTLASHDLIVVGAHTATHPILARAGMEVQREEIARSRRDLETWVERPVTSFAYPNGRPDIDFTHETIEAARAEGVECAFSMRHGFADPAGDPYGYARLLMLDSVSAPELAHRLTVSWRRIESRPS